MCMSSSSEAKPASPSSPANNSNGHAFRDPSWLKLDVCPEYAAHCCQRDEKDCPLAHPSSNISVVEGTVTCCFDFIKDRCQRPNCRYFHPPPLIKEQLVAAGKMHAQSRSRSKELSALAPDFHVYAQTEGTPFTASPYNLSCLEKVEVCREFMRRRCHRTVHECRFFHPEHHTFVDAYNMVTVCPSFATTGTCKINGCPYGHPLAHHKLHRMTLNPFPPYGMNGNYMQAHQMAMAAPYYHPLVFSSYQYQPNLVFPGSPPSSLYPNQFAHVIPNTTNYRPYSSPSTLWMPPAGGVFFGADYVSGTDLQALPSSFSAEMENSTSVIKMERDLARQHAIQHINNQN